jgi:hypothetical protein
MRAGRWLPGFLGQLLTYIGQRRREVFDLFIFVRDELLIRVVADSNHAQVKAKGSSPGYSTSRPFLDLRRGLERIARRFLLGEQNLEVPVDIGVGRVHPVTKNVGHD